MKEDYCDKAKKTPRPDEKVCFNCRYMMWMVAIGHGVQCRHPENEEDGKMFKIPARDYSC